MGQANKPNISIIVLDTLRLDAFNKLESQKGRSLSGIGEFVFAGTCIAPSSWTLPSHASLFTGMYPSEHGAHETKTIKALDIAQIKLRRRTFVSDLNDTGYATYAISANPYVHPIYGFDEFKHFKTESYFTDLWGYTIEVPERLKPLLSKYRAQYGGNFFKIGFAMLRDDPGLIREVSGLPLAAALTLKGIAKKARARAIEGWPIEKGGMRVVKTVSGMRFSKPFFLFINLMEAHDPYTTSKKLKMDWATPFLKKPVDTSTIQLWKRLYAKASERAYDYAYSIVEDLVERFGDDQIIILTSDHGQEFNEHGYVGHGAVLHDEVVKVPLAVMLPKKFAKQERSGYSSLVNVRRFISEVLQDNVRAADYLYSGEVRAESFGVPAAIPKRSDIDMRKLNSYNKKVVRTFRA